MVEKITTMQNIILDFTAAVIIFEYFFFFFVNNLNDITLREIVF